MPQPSKLPGIIIDFDLCQLKINNNNNILLLLLLLLLLYLGGLGPVVCSHSELFLKLLILHSVGRTP
jgi:hypothetical protein